MKIEVLTLFPEIFSGFLEGSLVGKAIERSLIEIRLTQIRDFADPPHFKVDDTPYGGGAGMVMKPEPLVRAIRDARGRLPDAKVVLLAASGRRCTQATCQAHSSGSELILVCGRYEGVDQRVIDLCVDEELAVGDFVQMGGEVPAMALIEGITRLIPGVLGNADSAVQESFSANSLEAAQYTRPAEFEGLLVPEILLSGDHRKIAAWREEQSKLITQKKRPDLVR